MIGIIAALFMVMLGWSYAFADAAKFAIKPAIGFINRCAAKLVMKRATKKLGMVMRQMFDQAQKLEMLLELEQDLQLYMELPQKVFGTHHEQTLRVITDMKFNVQHDLHMLQDQEQELKLMYKQKLGRILEFEIAENLGLDLTFNLERYAK
jgi:hypothetical protein